MVQIVIPDNINAQRLKAIVEFSAEIFGTQLTESQVVEILIKEFYAQRLNELKYLASQAVTDKKKE